MRWFDVVLFIKFVGTENVSGYYGAFTLDVKSVLNENLGGILGGMAPIDKWAIA